MANEEIGFLKVQVFLSFHDIDFIGQPKSLWCSKTWYGQDVKLHVQGFFF